LEFYYDVHVDFDNWLLAGHKKLCFSSKVRQLISNEFFSLKKDTNSHVIDNLGETNEFPITLVPLKTGHLLVPLIRVLALIHIHFLNYLFKQC
jgi:hypothetical protein